jgi:chromate transporter
MFRAVDSWQAGPLHVDVPQWTSLDPVAALLTLAALTAMLRFKLAMGWTLLAAALIGAAWRLL